MRFAPSSLLRRRSAGRGLVDDPERAARLLGFADARKAALKVVFEYTEEQEYRKLTDRLEQVLGRERLDALREEGALLTEEAAVDATMQIDPVNEIDAPRTAQSR